MKTNEEFDEMKKQADSLSYHLNLLMSAKRGSDLEHSCYTDASVAVAEYLEFRNDNTKEPESPKDEFKELVTQYIIQNREPPTNLSVSVELFAKMYNDGLIESLGGNTWHYNFITLSIKD